MQYLAGRLGEQDLLRADVTVEEAADVLWMLASFASFDALYTGARHVRRRGRAHARGDRRTHALPLTQLSGRGSRRS